MVWCGNVVCVVWTKNPAKFGYCTLSQTNRQQNCTNICEKDYYKSKIKENKYKHIQTNTKKKQREEMKAYAPSDRGTSAAVVVSQELLTATVTGLQPTKEREKASTIFFLFTKYFCCQQWYNQGEKKLRQCSIYLHNIFLLQSFHICVASKGTTKERKSFDNVLFL